MSYIALARKWRPQKFEDVLGQEVTLTALKNAIEQNKLHHAYLFSGTRGIGKTTLARLFAKAICCEKGVSSSPCAICETCIEIEKGIHVDVVEIDAASRTKVENTKEILDNIAYAPIKSNFKIYIIDEVHMLSNHSFNALLKTLEEPPPHVKFLLATTEPQKLPITILSRCLQFNLRKFNLKQLIFKITHILNQEKILFEDDAINRIAVAAKGSLRDALSLLEQVIAFGTEKITKNNVYSVIGLTFEEKLLELFIQIIDRNPEKLLEIIADLYNENVNFSNVLMQLQSLFHTLNLAQFAPKQTDYNFFDKEIVKNIANKLTPEQIQLYYQIAINGQKDFPFVCDEKLAFEMIMLRMLAFQPVVYNDSGFEKINIEKSNNLNQKHELDGNHNQSNANNASQNNEKNTKINEDFADNFEILNKKESNNRANNINWNEIVEKLNISGVTKILAMNSILKEFYKNNISIVLSENQKPLYSEKNKNRLEKALSDFFVEKIKLSIKFSDTKNKTPIESKSKKELQDFNELKEKVYSDPVVKEILENFDAKVEKIIENK